jgi:hypothetical protein
MTRYALMLELLEGRYDYDDDDSDTADRYDTDEWNDTQDIRDVFKATIRGRSVKITFSGEQSVAIDGEDDTHDTPGWSEVRKYGPVRIKDAELEIGGTYYGSLDSVQGKQPSEMKVSECAEDITETIFQVSGKRIKPLFGQQLAVAFIKHVDDQETGYA